MRLFLAGASVGYGFIEYTMPQEAAAAIRAMNRHQIENKTLKVSYARNPSPEIKNANMYVCGLSSDTDLEHLEALFRPFGTIITANLLKGLFYTISTLIITFIYLFLIMIY